MNTMVVLFALASVAYGTLVEVAQPHHQPAIVLDPHGRPLDTAEVINARAVHLQAKALEGHYAPLAQAVVIAPVHHSVVTPFAHSVYSSPLLVHSALGLGDGHLLNKRSLGHIAYSTPIIVAPSATSHQSRVDVISKPAVVSHAVAASVYAHAAPVYVHAAPTAVSHQSRVDVHNSPAIVSHSVAAPVWAHATYSPLAHSVHASPLWAHSALSHGHLLKKRSLGHVAYSAPIIVAPSAVSHQSRVDVISKPAVVSHAVAAPVYTHAAPIVADVVAAVSHQSRVDVHSSPAVVAHSIYAATPVAHSSFWSSPHSHLAHW